MSSRRSVEGGGFLFPAWIRRDGVFFFLFSHACVSASWAVYGMLGCCGRGECLMR